MSSTPQQQPFKAVRFTKEVNQPEISEEVLSTRDQYVFYIGPRDMSLRDYYPFIKLPQLDSGVINQIKNEKYRDRRQSGGDDAPPDRGEPVRPTVASEKTADEVRRSHNAGHIAGFLAGTFGNRQIDAAGNIAGYGRGVAWIRQFSGVDESIIQDISSALITGVPRTEDGIVKGDEYLKTFRANRDAATKKFSSDKKIFDIFKPVAKLIELAIQDALRYGQAHLAGLQAEMKQRGLPGGYGRGSLWQKDLEWITFIGKSQSDYESDAHAVQNQTLEMVAEVLKQTQPSGGSAFDQKQFAIDFAVALKQAGLIVSQDSKK